jgi:hypothetical protein
MNPLLKIERKISVSFSRRRNAHTVHSAVSLFADIRLLELEETQRDPGIHFAGSRRRRDETNRFPQLADGGILSHVLDTD